MTVRSSTSWAEIDLSAIRHNIRLIGEWIAPSEVAAVVKADAYGHGAVDVARAALDAGATRLCTFTAPEAIELRAAGINAPIICLGPVLPGDPLQIARHDITCVVDSTDTARRLAELASQFGVRLAVQLNLDSGMQRYGTSIADVAGLVRAVREHPQLQLDGVFTHLPDAANPDLAPTEHSLAQFETAADQLGIDHRHALASAAALRLPGQALSFARIGIALYGIDPAPELQLPIARQLRPVLSWRTRLLQVREVRRGERVSYGGLWTAPTDAQIGVIGAGYADGLRRGLSGGDVLIRGQRAPIIGAVCMDCAMIDLSQVGDTSPGDEVTLIGADGSDRVNAWEHADRLNTIPYEILTGIAARVPRVVVG